MRKLTINAYTSMRRMEELNLLEKTLLSKLFVWQAKSGSNTRKEYTPTAIKKTLWPIFSLSGQ